MRTEQEMMDLILSVAKQNENVRGVAMNGSRVNPNAPKDRYQDYDIVYLVREIEPMLKDRSWIDVFGERAVMQTPDEGHLFPGRREHGFAFLMQFTDGTRIDLTLYDIQYKEEYFKEDKLTVVLLDKDGSLPALPAPTDEDYRVQKPSQEVYADCCNEFFWTAPYVAKGLCRNEFLYAAFHMEQCTRAMLLLMLRWKAGIRTDFSVTVGKCEKYLPRYLDPEEWNRLRACYRYDSVDGIWEALDRAIRLFRETALFVGERLGYPYDWEQDEKTVALIQNMKNWEQE